MPAQNRVAKAPFNDSSADIIIRSQNGVKFYVFKVVLSLASPFFQTMFTLPQATSSETTPTIEVTEDSRTLYDLLSFCYPITSPTIRGLANVTKVLEAAMKYEMTKPASLMKSALVEYMLLVPREVYVVACRLGLEVEAKLAAKAWLGEFRKTYLKPNDPGSMPGWITLAVLTYLPEMVDISAGEYFRLLRYIHDKKDSKFVKADLRDTPRNSVINVPVDHPLTFENADIVLRTADGVDFRVHKVIVSLISPNLLGNESTTHNDLPVFDVPENGRTLATLLELCYPNGDPDAVTLEPPDLCAAVLTAAQKYKCSRAISLIKRHYRNEIKTSPLRVYFTAMRFGWQWEARMAALCAASKLIECVYVPEMEFTPADVYHRFLKYCHSLRSRIAELIRPLQQRRHVSRQVWCPQDERICHKRFPQWWYMDHEDAGSASAWVSALVVEHLQLLKHDDCDERPRLRENGELATEIEEGILEIQLEMNG